MHISTIGLDLAKSVFQVHAINETGEVVVRKVLRRSQVQPFFAKLPPCLVGLEACGTSHHWARELNKLGHRSDRACRLGDGSSPLPLRAPVCSVARPHSAAEVSGSKEKMGRISKMGDRYLRQLLVVGMTSLVRRARTAPSSVDPRIPAMLERRPARVVTVAAANRTARVACAIMTRGETYRKPLVAAA